MSLPEENINRQQDRKKSSIAAFLLLLVVVVGVAVFVYLKSQNVDLKSISLKDLDINLLTKGKTNNTEITEIKYETKENQVFGVYKDYIIKCNNDSITWLDKKGEQYWTIQASFSKPIIKTAGSYLLVADMGGKDICVINGKEIRWNKKVDNSIINVDINESGYTALVQEGKGYKAVISVFNPQGIERFTRTIAENFVISAKVLAAGKQILINRVDTSGVSASTNLEFNDLSNDKPFANIPVENMIFPSVWYFKDGGLFIAGDSVVKYYDSKRSELWKKEFSNIYSSNVALGKYAVVAVESGERKGFLGGTKTDIKVFDSEGEEYSTYTIEDEVTSIEAYGDVIAASTGRSVYFISIKGKLLSKHNTKAEVTGIYFFGEEQAVILTKNGILVVPV
ncbi:MAG: DUF5711 family protein [Clostridia bacterium]|nr:DUF5711 family protein [Clostridia bacterium]